MAEREPSPILTTPFSSVINHQLIYIADCLNGGYYNQAYASMRTLIFMLKRKHKQPLLDNHIKHINMQIFQARQKKTIERYDTKRKQFASINRILKTNMFALFSDIMEKLHEGGYLEQKGVGPRHPTRKTLGVRNE